MLSELDRTEGTRQQTTLFKGHLTARHFKLSVATGHDHFIAIYHLEVGSIEYQELINRTKERSSIFTF